MPKNLVIVESPAKAKTIERFLGSDYIVKSSFGHIRDLPKKGLNIDIEHGYAPRYEISLDKKKIVKELKQLALKHQVLLASDEDREGEAIAWHLAQALSLDPAQTKRIVFHEITKPAIEEAVKSPRTIDLHLVDAQQARRVLDRLVGYELSPLLWKKVRPGLSAGRVQSVAVRLIVEREREIRSFEPIPNFKVTAVFVHGQSEIPAQLNTQLLDPDIAEAWIKKTAEASFKLSDLSTKPSHRSPGAPFITSTLQQEASRRLGFSVRQTMTVAQHLYEAGKITYMRTDSTLLSSLAIASIGDFIKKEYGEEYQHVRQFKTRVASAQEAHEAIRPTDVNARSIAGDSAEQKLYDLIWKRTVASQMAEAKINRSEMQISISNQSELFIAKGESLIFDGFMRVWGGTKEDVILPKLKIGNELKLREVEAKQQFSRGPARYSEASLVRKLEELGIGRPSTYAPTISTIQSRGYVEKTDLEGEERSLKLIRFINQKIEISEEKENVGADKNKLIPTAIAEVTTDFLTKYFPSIVDYAFTASVEAHFDEIAGGKLPWSKMIGNFYKDFHPLVEQTQDVSRHEVSQARLLGQDPNSNIPIYARFGRYGPMLQRGETSGDIKPEFAPLPAGKTLDNVELTEALEMFKLPRLVGKTDAGEDILANIGRFGPYIKVGSVFVSIKGYDPHQISEVEAKKLYTDKLNTDANKQLKVLEKGIKILKGPYGPYITNGKRNVRIAKEQDPTKITQKEAEDLLAKTPTKHRRFKKSK